MQRNVKTLNQTGKATYAIMTTAANKEGIISTVSNNGLRDENANKYFNKNETMITMFFASNKMRNANEITNRSDKNIENINSGDSSNNITSITKLTTTRI